MAITACIAASGGPSRQVPGDRPGPRMPRPGTSVVPSAPPGANMQYVCRGNVPSGWIAVDYLEDAEGCATSRSRYSVAAAVRLTATPVNSSLEVCADQMIPRDWREVRLLPGDARCPSNKPDADPSRATVREISRMR